MQLEFTKLHAYNGMQEGGLLPDTDRLYSSPESTRTVASEKIKKVYCNKPASDAFDRISFNSEDAAPLNIAGTPLISSKREEKLIVTASTNCSDSITNKMNLLPNSAGDTTRVEHTFKNNLIKSQISSAATNTGDSSLTLKNNQIAVEQNHISFSEKKNMEECPKINSADHRDKQSKIEESFSFPQKALGVSGTENLYVATKPKDEETLTLENFNDSKPQSNSETKKSDFFDNVHNLNFSPLSNNDSICDNQGVDAPKSNEICDFILEKQAGECTHSSKGSSSELAANQTVATGVSIAQSSSLSDFIPNLQQHLAAWQRQLRKIQDQDSDATRQHIASSNLNSVTDAELQGLPAPIRCMYNMITDLKEIQKNILKVQQSIFETQNQVNMIVNTPMKYLGEIMQNQISPGYQLLSFGAPNSNITMTSPLNDQTDLADLIDITEPNNFFGSSSQLCDSDEAKQGLIYSGRRQKRFASSSEEDESNEDNLTGNSISADKKRFRSFQLDMKDDAPMPGVRYARDRNSWVAFWCEGGRQNYKSFSNKKFGFERARQMAIEARVSFDRRQVEGTEDSITDDQFSSTEFIEDTSTLTQNLLVPGVNATKRMNRSNQIVLARQCPTAQLSRNEYQQLAASLENPKGVCYAPSNNTWMAYGGHSTGPRMCKSFPVHKYGFFEARNLAIAALGDGKPRDGDGYTLKDYGLDDMPQMQEFKSEESDQLLDEDSGDAMGAATSSDECVNSNMTSPQGIFYNAQAPSWNCHYVDQDGVQKCKSYSTIKYGYEGAHNLVTQFMKANCEPLLAKPENGSEVATVRKISANSSTSAEDSNATPSKNLATTDQTNEYELKNTADYGNKNFNASTTHVKGVNFNRQCNTWAAIWYVNGVQQVKYFSVKQYGFEEAKRLAIEHRQRIDAHKGKGIKEKNGILKQTSLNGVKPSSNCITSRLRESRPGTRSNSELITENSKNGKESDQKFTSLASAEICISGEAERQDDEVAWTGNEIANADKIGSKLCPKGDIDKVGIDWYNRDKLVENGIQKRKSSHWKKDKNEEVYSTSNGRLEELEVSGEHAAIAR